MSGRRFVNTPFSEEVGYTLKVVNGPRFGVGGPVSPFNTEQIPFASVSGPITTGGFAPPPTAGGCYQVQTPQGNVLLKAYTPGYYNPPLAYDRCSVPRPFGPQPTGAGGCKCGCGCQGSCGCGCGAQAPPPPPPPGPPQGPPPPKPGGCSCPKCKAVMMGYAGESQEDIGPSYRRKRYQAGYFAPQYVNGYLPQPVSGQRPFVPTVGQVSRKPSIRPSSKVLEQQKEKKVARELLKGNIDALLEHLVDEKKAPAELQVAVEQVSGTTGHGKICMKQPCYEKPTQFTHLFSEPRSFDLQLSSPVICSGCGGCTGKSPTVGGCGCGANLNAPIQSYYSCIERAYDESRGVCPRQFQGYWNPWGQVNGPPTVGQTKFKLKQDPVEKLTDLIVVSTGFNPNENPKLRKIVETKLKESLAKEGIRVVAGQVSGPGTTGFLQDLVRGLGRAVNDVTRFVAQDVVNPMQQFVRQNATNVASDLASVDRQLGITRSLQQFQQAGGLQGLQAQLGQRVQWPEMAALGFGLAGPAVGLQGMAPVLGALGNQGLGGGLGAVSQGMQGLLQGANPLGRVLQQQGLGGAGLNNMLAAGLPAAGGLGHYGALIGQQPTNAAQQLLGGQQGMLQLLGRQTQVNPQNMFSGLQGLGRRVVQPAGQGVNFNALAGLLGGGAGFGSR